MSFLIGISGGSGSGKTSFIRDVKKQFSEKQLCVISQDDYYRPRDEQLLDINGVRNFDLPQSIDLESFESDIRRLKNGEVVSRKEYTFNNEKKEAAFLTFYPAPIIIIEGLFIYHYQPISDMLDLKIILHAHDSHKIIRRIKRDQKERNYPIDDVLYRYQHHVLPSYEQYINPYIDKVDIVVNNNINYDKGLEVLTGFLKLKLN